MLRKDWANGLVLVIVFGLLGCGGASMVVREPAEIPVRAYPEVILVHGSDWISMEVATRLHRYLVRPIEGENTPSVRLAHRGEASQWVSQRVLAPTTIVVDLLVQATGQGTAFTQGDTVVSVRPGLHASLTLTVRDSQTGRILQTVIEHAEDESRSIDRVRERVVRLFVRAIAPRLQSRRRRVRVPVLDAEHPLAEQGAEQLRDGQWTAARTTLESAVRDPGVAQLPPEARARVYYNLSVARRFDPATMSDLPTHYASAIEAAQEARRLDPERALYANTVAELAADADRAALLRQQQNAAAANYGTQPTPTPVQ